MNLACVSENPLFGGESKHWVSHRKPYPCIRTAPNSPSSCINFCFFVLEVKLIPFLQFSLNAGNKIDLADKREVSQQRAAEFSEAQDMYYLETSAKESDNVEKLFLDLACRLISEARQNTLVNNVSSPLPGEGKSISYLTCCNFN